MMSTSRYNPLWSDVMIKQNGRIPHFRINLYMLLVHNKYSIRSDPLAYVFGSPLVPCMVDIGSIRRYCLHSLAISPALLVNALFASIPIITSWFCLVSLFMNCAKCVIVRDVILSFSNLSWRIVHCCVSAVSVFVGSIVVKHTL